jgi:hypothetical protein
MSVLSCPYVPTSRGTPRLPPLWSFDPDPWGRLRVPSRRGPRGRTASSSCRSMTFRSDLPTAPPHGSTAIDTHARPRPAPRPDSQPPTPCRASTRQGRGCCASHPHTSRHKTRMLVRPRDGRLAGPARVPTGRKRTPVSAPQALQRICAFALPRLDYDRSQASPPKLCWRGFARRHERPLTGMAARG